MTTDEIPIKKKRVMEVFIQAAQEVIKDEGLEGVTLRKVSKLAGYNSATVYNYFDDLDQLVNYALLDSVTDYLDVLYRITDSVTQSHIRFTLVWYLYSSYSFQNPASYTYIFHSSQSERVLAQLDSFFRYKFDSQDSDQIRHYEHIVGSSIDIRDDRLIDPCVEDGVFKEEDKADIIRFCYALNLGMCIQVEGGEYGSSQEAAHLYLDFILDFIRDRGTFPETKEDLRDRVLALAQEA